MLFASQVAMCSMSGYRESAKKFNRCVGNQSMRPGKGVWRKPTWPPWGGCSRTTERLTCFEQGSEAGGTNGSLSALSTSVGTAMPRNQGLLLARTQ